MRKPDCLTKKTNEFRKWIPIKVDIVFLHFGVKIAKILTYQRNCKNVSKYKKSEIITVNIGGF
ncbi:hypothetical protein AGMMS50222_06650 [Endomicrobiia bacterium]|nr:hypothetical protein AGMMS49556_05100 [Endomicrobiia bacterium]GHT75526.1 hypothetical protein AGMMS50222_06650 [Endomicrobiia bacterium]